MSANIATSPDALRGVQVTPRVALAIDAVCITKSLSSNGVIHSFFITHFLLDFPIGMRE